MWIAARLLIAIVAYVARFLSGRWVSHPDGHYEGVPYFVRVERGRGGIRGFKLAVPFADGVRFRLSKEGRIDRLFKALGVSEEFQVGDASFDEQVYIACDHPLFCTALTGDEGSRGAIQRLFADGFHRIWSDGRRLWIERSADRRPTQSEIGALSGLAHRLLKLRSQVPSHLADPFVWKATAIEAVTWSIAAYAGAAVLDIFVHPGDIHVDPKAMVGTALEFAAALFVVLFGLILVLLRGSSRGHRILVESAILLLVGLPIAGFQMASDANREFDSSEPVVLRRIVYAKEQREHRGRRGRRSYSYHLRLGPGAAGEAIALPVEIEVDKSVFKRARQGATIQLTIGPGWLGHPWYRAMEFPDDG